MQVVAVFNCARVRGNHVQVADAPGRAAIALTVAEGTARSTAQLAPAEARRLAIWLLQRAEEIGA